MRRKDLKSLRVAISHHELNLGWDDDEDLSDHESSEAAEAEMATAPETDDTPPVSTMIQSSDPPPAEGQAHAMEVDDEGGNPPSACPVSPVDDELLTGSGAAEVAGGMANLMVSSPKHPDGDGVDASV